MLSTRVIIVRTVLGMTGFAWLPRQGQRTLVVVVLPQSAS